MVVTSRSLRGRPNLQNDQDSSTSSSPVTATTISINDHDASILTPKPLTKPKHDDAGSLRAKRHRIASTSDRESLQKRRRLSKDGAAGPPQVHIPLRGRAAPDVFTPGNISRNKITTPIVPPALVTQDSSISNSPLNSPGLRPQYDQFRRIEAKAQKVVKKHDPQEEKRKLRSEHGSTRSKTELAQYFPNFDDMLSLEPVDPNLLTARATIVLIDDTPGFEPAPPQPDFFCSQQPPHNSEILDLEEYAAPNKSDNDPLSDAVYLKAHQKAERHEKQMKNGDKERAQHEKYQLERLLEELRGPDWLKTLGISGITDTEKKRYEVKRVLFIRETKALIDKFKRWKEEEKRRKLEKQQALLDEAEADGDDMDNVRDERKLATVVVKARQRLKNGTNSRNRSRANSLIAPQQAPDSTEIDALAAQQLLEEAKSANLQRHRLNSSISAAPIISSLPEVPSKPFTSFFEKRHIRDAAVLGRIRGRKTYAFGQEVPELEDQDFELPESILNEDAIRVSQRSRRRRMRSIDEG